MSKFSVGSSKHNPKLKKLPMLAPVCNTVPIFPAIGSGVISFMNTGQTAKKHPQLIPTNNLPVRKNVVYGFHHFTNI